MTDGHGSRGRTPARPGAGGYTAIEVVLVLALVATLAGVAWPVLTHLVVRREATAAVEHVARVRAAAEAYAREEGGWPSEAAPGEVPPELAGRLGPDAAFGGPGYTLDWDVWPLPRGLPSAPGVESVAGITVVADGPRVDAWLREATTSDGWLRVGGGYTLLLPSPPTPASDRSGGAPPASSGPESSGEGVPDGPGAGPGAADDTADTPPDTSGAAAPLSPSR